MAMRKRLRKKLVKLLLSRMLFGDLSQPETLHFKSYDTECLGRFSAANLRWARRVLRVKRPIRS
jgi:hypothetical protein